ncbi:MAG: hypothetical protein ACKPKO_26535, partial [Candidatus Fonsibacter sp.]
EVLPALHNDAVRMPKATVMVQKDTRYNNATLLNPIQEIAVIQCLSVVLAELPSTLPTNLELMQTTHPARKVPSKLIIPTVWAIPITGPGIHAAGRNSPTTSVAS